MADVNLDAATLACLERLFSTAGQDQLNACNQRFLHWRDVLESLKDHDQARELGSLVVQLENMTRAPGTRSAVSRGGDDHDYGSFLKLARSVWFSWGPYAEPPDAQAASQSIWALSEVLAATDRDTPWRVLEIGAGTGAFAYSLLTARPSIRATLFDPSLESLVIAGLLLSGVPLKQPRRVDFDASPDGIGWFEVRPDRVSDRAVLTCSYPDADEAFDCVVAINALSLAEDPRAAVNDAMRRLAPGGLFIWIDLTSWRVETPVPRRVRGLREMVAICEAAGLTVTKRVRGIPYIEDWGFERAYEWRDNLVVARRGAAR